MKMLSASLNFRVLVPKFMMKGDASYESLISFASAALGLILTLALR